MTNGLPVDYEPRDNPLLHSYANLLERWNAKKNLVGRRDITDLWERHISDALFMHRCLPLRPDQNAAEPGSETPGWVLDIGTGAGLPGMVLAILEASCFSAPANFVLLDRSERKVRFLTQVVAELQLTNVLPLCADFCAPLNRKPRADLATQVTTAPPDTYPIICARAVAPPKTLWAQLQHLLAPGGALLVAAGPQTRTQLPAGVEVQWFADPAQNAQRGVVELSRGSPIDDDSSRQKE